MDAHDDVAAPATSWSGSRYGPRVRFATRLALIAGVALAWRLLYVQLELPYRMFTDEAWYISEAHRLFSAHPWSDLFDPFRPSAQHGPLTSLVVAPFAWMFPHALAGLRNVMAVLGTATVVMMGVAARAIGGDRVGLIAASVAAVFPDFWIRDGLVVAEPVATLLVVTAVWVTVLSLTRATPLRVAALGVLAGLIALARPEESPAILVLALVVIVRRPAARRVLLVTVLVLAVAFTVAPWTVYNQGRFKDTVVLSNDLGITLAGANCHRTYYSFAIMGYDSVPCENAAYRRAARVSSDESIQSSVMRRAAVTFVLHHLDRVPLVVVMREVWFLGLYRPGWVVYASTSSDQPAWATWLQAVSFYFFFAGAMTAWWLGRHRRWPHWLLAVLVLNSFVVAGVFVGHWRYRITLDVAIVLLLALGADAWWSGRDEHAAAVAERSGQLADA